MSMKTTLTAGLVALTLGATALFAAPAQAASPTFSFSLGLGGPSFGIYPIKPGIVLHYGDDDYFDYCLESDEVVYLINHNGYRHAKVVDEDFDNDYVWVVAQKKSNGYWYQMRVDVCTREVDHIKRVKVKTNSNGVVLSFNFGF